MSDGVALRSFGDRLFGSLVLLACLLFVPHGFGQSTEPAPSAPPSYAVLADLLDDEQARGELIEQLRAMAASPGGQQPANQERSEQAEAPPSEDGESGDPSLSRRLAVGLQEFTGRLSNDLSSTGVALVAMLRGEPSSVGNEQRWSPEIKVLAVTIAALLLAYFVLRMVARIGFARLNSWIQKPPHPERARAKTAHRNRVLGLRELTLSRKLLGVLFALIIDWAAALLAALVGYITATAVAQQPDDMTFAFQLLIAFVLIEAVKATVRGVFATRYDHLRLLPIEPVTASYWNRWLGLLIGLTGYCLLVIVPVCAAVLTPAISRLIGFAIMLIVYGYALGVIWSRRKTVRAGLIGWADKTSTAVFSTLIRVLARTWHLLATGYFTMLLVVSQADQQQALSFMLQATLQSVIAIGVGALLAAALSSLLERRISLPDAWSSSLPMLEKRINSYVPAALKGLRFLILIVVALVVLDAWRFFNLVEWLASPGGQAAVAMVFHIALILAIAALSWTLIASIIEHRLGGAPGSSKASEREKTLLMLFRNAAAVVIGTMTVLILLSQIGVNIGPLIAGAGVAGLAIGFGAQKLVQDVITGVFIQLENGMNQNDIVEVLGLFGTVEKITIRSVVLRSLDGGYHLIPFSAIDKFTNHTRDYGYHYGEYYVAYGVDIDLAMSELKLAFEDLMNDPELAREVLEEIEIPGVTALDQRGFRVRVLIKTTPGNQWAVQRGFNRLVKQRFDAAGIELPYPQTVVHFKHKSDEIPGARTEQPIADLLQKRGEGVAGRGDHDANT